MIIRLKKCIYLFFTGLLINYKKKLIMRSEKRIEKLEIKLVKEKQLYKHLLKNTIDYSNIVLKTERNM
ncbi:hypothetical protein [Clostridium neonatale]|uniref:Uncharacterized protein n=1 Tax=Clostridium neonatale TaxID=137838 RepID=A0AA86JDL7_9CLOT|nr:hypothetical protein [Clostridium neonatale]CAG9703749.1 conserved hypothetical protein [Clostridium neonatale]CAI3545265.1 conserved hypothetical protein [Clostridium neonatale]CAI3566083.1 conserved hypothetical protein [Clostridium neonatale]CAI3573961.1 conserved hypothetical protein [Clostridium neonatale]CAI3593785.1 conserved hypothetical protein [Clostridium neonatale]